MKTTVTLRASAACPSHSLSEVSVRDLTFAISDGPATEEQLQTVAREVEKFCPLSKLFVAAGTAVETVWTKA